jgi:hypothetical protein
MPRKLPLRPLQHGSRTVNPNNPAFAADPRHEVRNVQARTASKVEDSVPRAETQSVRCNPTPAQKQANAKVIDAGPARPNALYPPQLCHLFALSLPRNASDKEDHTASREESVSACAGQSGGVIAD